MPHAVRTLSRRSRAGAWSDGRPGACGDPSNHDGKSGVRADGSLGKGRRYRRMDQQGRLRPHGDGAKRRLRPNDRAEEDGDLRAEESRHRRLLLSFPSKHEGDAQGRAVAFAMTSEVIDSSAPVFDSRLAGLSGAIEGET